MLKPTKMSRLVIVGTNDVLEPAIEALHNLNLLHITDFTGEDSDFKIGKPLKPASKLSQYILSLRSISTQLGITETKIAQKKKIEEIPREIEERLAWLEKEVSARHAAIRKIEEEVKEKEALEAALEPLSALPLPLEAYHGYSSITVSVGLIEEDLEALISKIVDRYEIFTGDYKDKKVFALFAPREFEARAARLLQEEPSYVEIKAPELKGRAEEILDEIAKTRASLKEKSLGLEAELENIKKEYAEFILASEEYLSIETQKAEAPLRFATSKNAFVIDGWVPASQFEKLRDKIYEAAGSKVYIGTLEVVDDEEIPIALENPTPVRPFEMLVDIFATPKYREIDPSTAIFITFPLFYAIMLGDVGYGALIAGLSLFIRSKFKTGGLRSLSDILLYASVLSIILGVVYGELFGFPLFNTEFKGELEKGLLGISGPLLGPLHLPVHRFESVKQLLLLTLIIGLVHLFLGLSLGFRNKAIEHGFREALFKKGSWIMILAGGVTVISLLMPSLMAGEAINKKDPFLIFGGILAILGVGLLIKGEGFIAIMEIPTLLSNVLSYSRILAIGLSSAGIALAVNTLAMDLFIRPGDVLLGKGPLAFLMGVLVLFLGHLINLILGIIGPGLHSLRLQYVEFFTKFYEGGGKKYCPFGYTRKYTEE